MARVRGLLVTLEDALAASVEIEILKKENARMRKILADVYVGTERWADNLSALLEPWIEVEAQGPEERA
jgi:hypothetical protein